MSSLLVYQTPPFAAMWANVGACVPRSVPSGRPLPAPTAAGGPLFLRSSEDLSSSREGRIADLLKTLAEFVDTYE
ncbi:MAG: hypothetical protein WAV54_14455, partial [Acidimicrobiales bacterium]